MNSFFTKPLAKPGSAIAVAVASLLSAGAAQAAPVGTASDTSITNLATLNYAIGGTAQTPIGSSPTGNTTGPGTNTSFKVDNKVNLSVTTVNTAVVSVSPGSTNQVTTFTVTNLGNSAQGYTLAGANTAGAVIGGIADSIDVTNVRVFVESGTNLGYQPLEDMLSAISTLASGDTKNVYIVADIPVGAANGAQANVSLTVTTTTDGTTTAVSQTTGADTAGVDIVFADALTAESGFVGASPARDAKATARDAYRVASATVTVTKTVAPLCDPFNGTTNPKNIPSSLVRYTITVLNGGPTPITLTSIADPLNSNVTFDANLITGAGGTLPTNCASDTGTPKVAATKGFEVSNAGGSRASFPKSFTTASDADGIELAGTTVSVDFSKVLPVEAGYLLGELKPTESVSLIFNVQVN